MRDNIFNRTLLGHGLHAFFGIDSLLEGAVKLLGDLMSGMILAVYNIIVGDAIFIATAEGTLDELTTEDVIAGGGLAVELAQSSGMLLDNPPNLNTAGLIRSTLAHNVLNPEPVYAQGLNGNEFFEGMRTFWGVMLDIGLGLSLLFLIATGFMIMFSGVGLIGPKTKVTVLSTLPQIFVALFFAVFSLVIRFPYLRCGECDCQHYSRPDRNCR